MGEEELIKLGDKICVLERQQARLHEEIAARDRELADRQQKIGDLLHEVDHHKYVANHATKLLEQERKEKATSLANPENVDGE
jgi:hypothetical protein